MSSFAREQYELVKTKLINLSEVIIQVGRWDYDSPFCLFWHNVQKRFF
ncbi:hypothetical protein [Risungbinella massiliensis]|nr:hypothetical protein [Risungbinella massiliensis]